MGNTSYADDYRNIDFRKHPELYKIGRGEQGVLITEPYKSEILPYWKFKTPEIAEASARKIYELFGEYKQQGDFVGMDMARKFLQMGFTRARRYANHASGKKYAPDGNIRPQESDWKDSEKAQSAAIFYRYYVMAKDDSEYLRLKADHKKRTGSYPPSFDEIFAVHEPLIDVRQARTKPVLVVFSAIPGSGKSELTKRLVRDYGFVRIANKDIRESIAKTGHEDDVNIGEYTLWLFDKLTADKKASIVFDRNIDQWYTPSKEWAEKNGYRYVLVRIDVQREILEQRLLQREKSCKAKAFEVLDFYAEQHELTRADINPAITFINDYDLDLAAAAIANV